MSDKVYVGQDAASVEQSDALQPISKVIIWYDDDNAYSAGDDTGRTMEIDCPFATQEMADNVLASVSGYTYKPFSAVDALMDPAAELGDGVTVGNVYSVLADISTQHDALPASDISAPGEEEIDHEYPYLTPQDRELKRKVTLGASYYGTKITRKEGLVIERTDGETVSAKAVFNADELSFYAGNDRVLYFDPTTGTYKFTGTLNVADKFIVDPEGNVTIAGNLRMTGTSNWIQVEYSTDKSTWTAEWDDAWTNIQVWARYSYDGGTSWTDPIMVQGKNGEQGPPGSSASIPAWVQAYTQSAQFNTLVTDEWVVTMNLYASKLYSSELYAGQIFDSDGNTWIQMGKYSASSVAYLNQYAAGHGTDPVVSMGYVDMGSGTGSTWVLAPFMATVGGPTMRFVENVKTMRCTQNWDFSGASVSGIDATFG